MRDDAGVATPPRAAAWLARPFATLAARLAERAASDPAPAPDFDVVVVGSGYGGAVAAAGLAGCRRQGQGPVTVCVLERGNEYLAGAFPARMADLPRHVRCAFGGSAPPVGLRDGLFDVRVGADLSAVVANGLGGGSLINAGVMLRPESAVLARLPGDPVALRRSYARVRKLLGVATAAGDNTIERHRNGPPAKFDAHQAFAAGLAGGRFQAAPLSISMRAGRNSARVAVAACKLCGDCATGCNHEAKNSLDTNLLARARRQGAELYTGATILRIERVAQDTLWCLHVVHTDRQRRERQGRPLRLYASTVVLAAGTFGSTEILLRSQTETLRFSPMLGRRLSGNGDMIAVRYDEKRPVHAGARETDGFEDRAVGPTITGMVRSPRGPDGAPMLVQEMAVPAALRRLFQEIVSTGEALHRLAEPDHADHDPAAAIADPAALDEAALERSAILAVMTDDGADGRLELLPGVDDTSADGALRIRWPALRDKQAFADAADTIAAVPRADGTRARVLHNPAWRALPDELDFLLLGKRGPLLTVHPLGGCAMADDVVDGVVNAHGHVFRAGADGDGTAAWPSLLVLDGAIVPCALGANPALTIAALALRAVEALRRERQWRLPPRAYPHDQRPRMRAVAPVPPHPPAKVQLVERMSGPVTLAGADGAPRNCIVELTLRCRPQPLADPGAGGPRPDPMRRSMLVDPAPGLSVLRVYDAADWEAWPTKVRENDSERPPPLLTAPLSGRIDFMHRSASSASQRLWRAAWAWLRNRGARELWQAFATRLQEGGSFTPSKGDTTWWQDVTRRRHTMAAFASRAGEVRCFDYDLTIGTEVLAQGLADASAFQGARIAGTKRIAYAIRANPWHQMTRLALQRFPLLAPGQTPVLSLDTGFLVRENVALLRILTQPDKVEGLADFAALAMYLARVLLPIHVLSLRKPDTPKPRVPQRLPGPVPGLPVPEIADIDVDRLPDGSAVHVRLTRYVNKRAPAGAPPVVAVHGFSASGTTFAHRLVRPNLVSTLWHAGREVWVLDLRTSSGMPAARQPWTFEEVATTDLPAAIDHICRVGGCAQVDVVAHCIGGAMIGMAVLAPPVGGERFHEERQLLPGRIRRMVLSQMGPLMVFSQSNIMRGYLMNSLRRYLPFERYQFRVDGEPTLLDEALDRALCLMPYPDGEFRLENPVWPWQSTAFAGTRHRLDALYGRTFSLRNMQRRVLAHIDDFFGPVDVETLGQTISFARLRTVANQGGRNQYVSRAALAQRWTFPTLCLHGEENGVTTPATMGRIGAILRDAGCPVQQHLLPGFGHQDCWIGRDAGAASAAVAAFLAAPDAAAVLPPAVVRPALIARIPWLGPVLTAAPEGGVGAASDPTLNGALLAVFVPVVRVGERYHVWQALPPAPTPAAPSMLCVDVQRDRNGWMRLAQPCCPGDAEGCLLLLIYDEAPELALNAGAAYLTRGGAPAGMASAAPSGSAAAAPLAISAALLAQNPGLANAVTRAVLDELAGRPAAQLREGVLAPRPDPAAGLCFVLAAGQYPTGLLDRAPAFASWRRLAGRLDGPGPYPAFLVTAGNLVYADATAGLFDPRNQDDRHVRPYETLYGSEEVRAVLRRLPSYMMLNDREIADNWEGGGDGTQARLRAARHAYLVYQRCWTAQRAADPALPLWYTFQRGGFPFFVADTRTEREPRTPGNADTAVIMGRRQFGALLRWLYRQPRAHIKFVVCGALLAPRKLRAVGGVGACLASDGWDGYPASLGALLRFIARHDIGNVVFLSGDDNLSCDATLTLTTPTGQLDVRAINSAPLYGPFPFANLKVEELCGSGDTFELPALPRRPGRTPAPAVGCTVRIHQCRRGDGFAVLTAGQGESPAQLAVQFDLA